MKMRQCDGERETLARSRVDCGQVCESVGRLRRLWEGQQVCRKVGKYVGRSASLSKIRRHC